MKKELTLGTPSVPVLRISAERFRELLNRVLPEECQVKNATDCWYAGAAVSGVLTCLMPWLLIAYAAPRMARKEQPNDPPRSPSASHYPDQ